MQPAANLLAKKLLKQDEFVQIRSQTPGNYPSGTGALLGFGFFVHRRLSGVQFAVQ
jgi:hypothetical protein